MSARKAGGVGGGMKSALELAMERTGGDSGKTSKLTEEQREALQEAQRELEAKVAEVEIMAGQQAAEAGGRGDAEETDRILARKAEEIGRLRRAAERRKEEIRRKAVRSTGGDGP